MVASGPAAASPQDIIVQVQGHSSSHTLTSAFVMPGDDLHLEVAGASQGAAWTLPGGKVSRLGPTAWRWTAPLESGHYDLILRDPGLPGETCIRVFVLVPYDGSNTLHGYKIGSYPYRPLDGDPAYRRPVGLVEVTPENETLLVSPHFQLGEFLCKQDGEYPKYLALQTPLLLELEALYAEVNQDPAHPVRLHVMSAYRTPAYNRKIGNRTSYSRHLYGDAADVYVDTDGDEWMDDLDGNGRVDAADAGLLFQLMDGREAGFDGGGLGVYGPRKHRGPFVHVDTRGSHARWADAGGRSWLKSYEDAISADEE